MVRNFLVSDCVFDRRFSIRQQLVAGCDSRSAKTLFFSSGLLGGIADRCGAGSLWRNLDLPKFQAVEFENLMTRILQFPISS